MIFRPSGYGRKQPCLPRYLERKTFYWKPLLPAFFACGISGFVHMLEEKYVTAEFAEKRSVSRG